MPELELQKYLRAGNSLESLAETYTVQAKRDSEHPNLVLFKYNQIQDPPWQEKIVQESRGIVLNVDDNWNIVCRAFDKFFNLGEVHASSVDWDSAVVFEKLDGSLATTYQHNGKWRVASTGSPNAAGFVNKLDFTFSDYFRKTSKQYSNLFSLPPPDSLKNYCFFFELMGPDNRIVVAHPEPKLALLGGRNLITGQELTPEQASELLDNKFPVVRHFPLSSIQEIIDTFKDINPLSQEGYVVCDKYFSRIKVKHPGYVALHHAKDQMTEKAFVEIVRNGETSEVLTAFPEFKPMMDSILEKYHALVRQIDSDYQPIKDLETQKEFALQAVQTKCSGALFALRSKSVESIEEHLKKIHIKNLMMMLGLKDSPEPLETT